MSSLAIRLHVNLSVPLSMWDSMDTQLLRLPVVMSMQLLQSVLGRTLVTQSESVNSLLNADSVGEV